MEVDVDPKLYAAGHIPGAVGWDWTTQLQDQVKRGIISKENFEKLNSEAGIKNAGLDGVFAHVLSTDQIRAYKPEPRAYQMALDALQLQREEILFVAFAGWDAAGAKWFGYPTFWVNRLHLPGEALGVTPDAMGRDLTDVVRFVTTPR